MGSLQRMLRDNAPWVEVSKIVALPFDQGYIFYARHGQDVRPMHSLFDVASFLAANPEPLPPLTASPNGATLVTEHGNAESEVTPTS